jgi:ABC-2 type transport system ATP-binding protein
VLNLIDKEIAIQIKDLTKIYKSNNVKAVDSLDLEIYKGEIFGLLGPNGAGKTTLIRMLVGLLESTSGTILFNGEEISPSSSKLRRLIGYVPQDLVIWKGLTTYENLHVLGTIYEIPEKDLKERINHLLEGLYLLDKKKEKASKLSGGMQRRLNLAMGMVHDPQILLLDEVFIGLDPQTRVYLYDYLRDFAAKEEKTIIITSHLMEIVDTLADRVGIVDLGKMLAVDAPEQLKNTFGKGDVLELDIEGDFEDNLLLKIESSAKDLTVSRIDSDIQITTLNAISKIPAILHCVEGENYAVDDIRITKQSLETVFISLTGKALRSE